MLTSKRWYFMAALATSASIVAVRTHSGQRRRSDGDHRPRLRQQRCRDLHRDVGGEPDGARGPAMTKRDAPAAGIRRAIWAAAASAAAWRCGSRNTPPSAGCRARRWARCFMACCLALLFIDEPKAEHRAQRYIETLGNVGRDLWNTARVARGISRAAVLLPAHRRGRGQQSVVGGVGRLARERRCGGAGQWRAGRDRLRRRLRDRRLCLRPHGPQARLSPVRHRARHRHADHGRDGADRGDVRRLHPRLRARAGFQLRIVQRGGSRSDRAGARRRRSTTSMPRFPTSRFSTARWSTAGRTTIGDRTDFSARTP